MDAETSRFSGPKVEAWDPNDEGRPDGRPSRSRSAGLQGSCKSYALVGRDSGGGIRTRDLRVMSPTSYQTAPPRVATFVVAENTHLVAGARRSKHVCGTPKLPSALHSV